MSAPRLKKELGQHHLVDGALCRPLLSFLRAEGEPVLEIGPGGGVLTAELLGAKARRVWAWELDVEWALELRRRLPDRRLAVVVADALEIPWQRFEAPLLVAGNLPYNVGTAILLDLLPRHRLVPRGGFLVQREVAERLVAGPGAAAYGSLSVMVAAYAEARVLSRVRRGSFRPPPKVEGAFVGLELKAPPLPEEQMPAFSATVRQAFAQRRKTLLNSLAKGWGTERARRALASAHLAERVRAERLGLEELLALHQGWCASAE